MRRLKLLPLGHPDRSVSVEAYMEPAYQALILRMMQAGITGAEAALALESLAQADLDTMRANAETDQRRSG